MPKPLTYRASPIDRLASHGAPDAAALVLRHRTLDYAALDHEVGRLSMLLLGEGLAPGDRVASWAGKGLITALMPLAAVRAGLIHVPVNPLLKRAQVAHILADSGARMLIANAGRAATVEAGDVPAHCALIDIDMLAAAVERDGDSLPPSDHDPAAIAAILYTSGSTGRPKGVVLTSVNLWLGAESVARYLALAADDRLLGVLPLSFDYGQNQLLSAWYAGASVVPFDYLAPRDVVRAVENYGATTLAGVPPMWVQLLEADWPLATAARLRRLTNSGGALTPTLVRRLRERFPHAALFAMYGLTEAFRSTFLDPRLIDARPESIGQAVPHAEVLIVRPDGTPTDPGEPGELVHCGPLVAQGYWQDAARTAQQFRPAPAHSVYGGTAVWSGDTAWIDGEGLISFVGRDDAMIKSSGNRISPTEIEEVAEATGFVAEAVALGVPDSLIGETIALVVRPVSGRADISVPLRRALQTALPNFMQPRHIIARDALPLNANGKLDRPAIVAAALAEIAGG